MILPITIQTFKTGFSILSDDDNLFYYSTAFKKKIYQTIELTQSRSIATMFMTEYNFSPQAKRTRTPNTMNLSFEIIGGLPSSIKNPKQDATTTARCTTVSPPKPHATQSALILEN